MKLITLTNGHNMCSEVYNNKLKYFGKCLANAGFRIIDSAKPYFGFDFTYLVSAKDTTIPLTTMEIFGKAGLKTIIDDFSDENSEYKTFFIRFKY